MSRRDSRAGSVVCWVSPRPLSRSTGCSRLRSCGCSAGCFPIRAEGAQTVENEGLTRAGVGGGETSITAASPAWGAFAGRHRSSDGGAARSRSAAPRRPVWRDRAHVASSARECERGLRVALPPRGPCRGAWPALILAGAARGWPLLLVARALRHSAIASRCAPARTDAHTHPRRADQGASRSSPWHEPTAPAGRAPHAGGLHRDHLRRRRDRCATCSAAPPACDSHCRRRLHRLPRRFEFPDPLIANAVGHGAWAAGGALRAVLALPCVNELLADADQPRRPAWPDRWLS